MSSIRPLVTITILVVVGAYLYVKINEGSLQPAPDASESWNQTPDGVPPLATANVTPTTGDSTAPAWGATASPPMTTATAGNASTDVAASTAAPAEVATATPDAAPVEPPAMPAMPEMPELATANPAETNTTSQAAAPLMPAVPLPTELPANIPEARYPDQAATNITGAQVESPLGAVPPTVATPEISQPPGIEDAPTQVIATTPEEMNAAAAANLGVTSPPLSSQPNPLRQSPLPTADAGRYGADTATVPPTSDIAAAITPVEPSFTESWPTIQAALDRGELAQAHQQLSRWYRDPSLTPTDAERVESLLSQLAGTVVYSTEHRLAPAHVVKQGETLETIAAQYNVPSQLLAKINGVAAPNQVRPGQELKVIRGPFNAVVDLARNQLTLTVDGRYAGKFPVIVSPGQTISDGEWVVGKKSNEQAPGRALLLQGAAAAPGTPATTLIIASDTLATTAADGSVIKVSAKDAEELSDILSVGSRVVTRR